MEFLLNKGLDVNALDMLRHSPLAVAFAVGAEGVIKLLTERGADENVKDVAGFVPCQFAELMHGTLSSMKK